MPDWNRQLDITDIAKAYRADEIGVKELCAKVGKRVLAIRDFGGEHEDLDDERREIGEEFEYIGTQEDTEIDDFDAVLSNLYDWADTPLGPPAGSRTPKACWVKPII